MQYEWLIIDGYNVLHQVEELAKLLRTDLQGARHRLVRMIEETAHNMAKQTTIVFDGREAGSDAALSSKYLEVLFSPGNLSADTVIERLVCKLPNPGKSLVVTSDHAEHDTVSSAGAQTMSSEEFMDRCERESKKKISKRTHLDIASVNTAASLRIEDGRIAHACLAAGGVAPIPTQLPRTADYLCGREPTAETAIMAADVARSEITPISDVRGSAEYKRLLLGQLILAHFNVLFDVEEGLLKEATA